MRAGVVVVAMTLVVTLALTSLISVYDKGVHAIVRQPGVTAAAAASASRAAGRLAAVAEEPASAFGWLEERLARLRFDDRIAEAIRSDATQEPARSIATIAPADAAPTANAAAAADPTRVGATAALPSEVSRAEAADLATFGKDLSETLVSRFASPDRMVIVSFVNSHYMDFARNWVRHLRAAGNRYFLVGALDDAAYTALRATAVPSFDMAASLTTRDFGWGSKVFKQAQQKKIAMFLKVLHMGFSVLLSDIDVFYLKDPFGFFRTVPDASLLVSSDLLAPTVADAGPEAPHGAHATLNVGIIFMRPTNATIRLTDEWNEMCSKNLDFWEQAAFNQLVKGGAQWPNGRGAASADARPYGSRIVGMFRGTVPTAVLPVATFCSGHTAFVQNLPATLGRAPYALHATFQFAGTAGKRHRFREWQQWEDEADYYDPPAGLLLLDGTAPPAALLRPGGVAPTTVAQHFALVNWQLSRIRSGLILAELTGRVLVMPPLFCGMDRWWAPHTGRIPGAHFELPFLCPLDHVFNIEQGMSPTLIREWSLLDNARTPRGVLASQFNLSLPSPLSAAGVTAALTQKRAKHAKLLRIVDTPPDVYQAVLTEKEQAGFARRAHNYLNIWCCIQPLARGKPGHIWCAHCRAARGRPPRHAHPNAARARGLARRHVPNRYDLFWDVIPHTDRWQQKWTSEWLPRPSK
jgi:hypothetical protein